MKSVRSHVDALTMTTRSRAATKLAEGKGLGESNSLAQRCDLCSR
jgi:hypothetical protein